MMESPTATTCHGSSAGVEAAEGGGDGKGLGLGGDEGLGAGLGDGLGEGEGDGDGLSNGLAEASVDGSTIAADGDALGSGVAPPAQAATMTVPTSVSASGAWARAGRTARGYRSRRLSDVDERSPTMYTYIVQRTQIYLTEEEARTLDRLAKERRQTRSHLIREAIRETYGTRRSHDEFMRVLDAAFGAWVDRTPEEAAERDRWLRDLRGPGLGYKIAALRGEPMPDPEKDRSR
jgi:predicted transcriptional regulator